MGSNSRSPRTVTSSIGGTAYPGLRNVSMQYVGTELRILIKMDSAAVAEIEPTSVNINTQDQAFSYYIEPTINAGDSGVDKIEITVPGSYSDVNVTGVLVGGASAAYTDNTAGNTISITLDTKVTTDGTDLRVNFTADTPTSVDSGVDFTSTLDDTSNPDPVSCTSGDGDGGGSVTTDTWTVTTTSPPSGGGGGGCFIATVAY